jgi:hypothetical protein
MSKSKTLIEIRSLARSHTRTALNVLVGIMRSKDATAAARVSAANAILDRGWGKATQTVETGDDSPLELIHRIEDHTADSIKSLEGFRIAWVDEAQNLSARVAWRCCARPSVPRVLSCGPVGIPMGLAEFPILAQVSQMRQPQGAIRACRQAYCQRCPSGNRP